MRAISDLQNVYRDNTRELQIINKKPEHHEQIKIRRRAENQSNVQIMPLKKDKPSRNASVKDSGVKEPPVRDQFLSGDPIVAPSSIPASNSKEPSKNARLRSPQDRFKLPSGTVPEIDPRFILKKTSLP